MLVVIPVCSKDVELAESNLEWCRRIEEPVSFECLISVEHGVDTTRLVDLAKGYFKLVHHYTYDKYNGDLDWPKPQNYAWQTTARYVAEHFKVPWFWWEADATPLKPGWLSALSKEYYESGMPFMGHRVKTMGHMNGVAVYPNTVAQHSTDSMICRTSPFDVMMWKDIRSKFHDASHLMAHFPRYSGLQLSFEDPAAVAKLLDKGYVIFHGCNDGTIIELLKGQVPKRSMMKKFIRWFTPSDVGTYADEAETMWQWEAGRLQEKGYGVLPFQDCTKPMPSVFKQTKWPGGVFSLPLNGRECHYNCGFVRFAGQRHLITRKWLRANNGTWHSSLVAWSITEDMFPQAPIELKFPGYSGSEQYEDPRIVAWNGSFWIGHCVWRHDRIYRAHQSLSSFSQGWQFRETINIPYGGNGYHIGTGSGQEKNWIWFRHDNHWHFVYSWQPHVVVRVNDNFHVTEYKSSLKHPIDWIYGEVRGGTPPVLTGSEYVSFFHSSLAWKGRKKRYYMGAYAFSAVPPFQITRFTRKPILTASDEDTRILDGPLVVFPCGSDYNNGEWLLTFGINDEACGWLKVPHGDLSELMEPV